ncbi:hypothetical protein Taro_023331 [Colocasia esculenta]|uniref:C2H2-type domain-containing protein n=1 Tax=Colocasia esculenta TaxID=4460 RepID=A0A843VH11_COLES|nr:hypothetical protein [Colocasia esculenta]
MECLYRLLQISNMSMAKVSTYRAPDSIVEQKTGQLGIEGHDSLDNYIIQAIGKEPFLSFSRPGESPVQWIQLLHALEQQGSGKRGALVDNVVEENGRQQGNSNGLSSFASENNGIKEPGNMIKSTSRVAKSSSEHMQALKIPEAVVAFAQAAAKANDLPGWPLLSPSKMQLQKCDKCSREFCSPVNYRRHIRVHRRSLNVNKVSPKNRELLGAFWDKLSLDEAKELVSIKDMTLEEVPAASIIRALASLMRKPGFSSLPQVYLKGGAILLDLVECRPSVFPISSQELFSVLDDASEKTFLCGGTAISLQRFVFDGEVGKISMEMKNLIACTSFLLEQKLVKAWLADKDAEALRCQKLLFEEEEAAQKRQAELLERKRMKKLRQKEQKMKEQTVNKPESEEALCDTVEGTSGSEEALNSMLPSGAGLGTTDSSLCSTHSTLEDTQPLCMVADRTYYLENEDAEQYLEYQVQQESTQRQPTLLHRSLPRPLRYGLGGFHPQVAGIKSMVGQKHNGFKDTRPTSAVSSQMVWTRKSKSEFEEGDTSCKGGAKGTKDSSDGIESCKVLIGSISVPLKDCNGLDENEVSLVQNTAQERQIKISTGLNKVDHSEKLHVENLEDGGPVTVQHKNTEADITESPDKSSIRILPDQSCLATCTEGDCWSEMKRDSFSVTEVPELSSPKLFSSKVAEAFLSQRWRDALSSDHVKLILSPDTDARSMDDGEIREESCADVACAEACEVPLPLQPVGSCGLSNHENQGTGMGSNETTSTIAYKPKFRTKPEKSYSVKYIPKQS